MDLESIRGLERILVVAGGALCVVLGYLLFRHMPNAPKGSGDGEGGEGKVQLPGGISIYVSRVGPGVFFALFGSLVLALSFLSPLVIVEEPAAVPGAASSTATQKPAPDKPEQPAVSPAMAGQASEPQIGAASALMARRTSYLQGGLFDGMIEDIEGLETARLRVRDHVGFLNGLLADLKADLPQARRDEIERRLRNAKLDMIQVVWGNWGDRDAFADWVRLGAKDPPPPDLEAPAALYRHGSEP